MMIFDFKILFYNSVLRKNGLLIWDLWFVFDKILQICPINLYLH